MNTVKVHLQPIVSNLNLPTVLKTAILPGETTEKLLIATQIGEIFHLSNGNIGIFLDIRSRILELGASGGYDERGLLGLAFHPEFSNNGLFYLHYSVAGTQGPGALSGRFHPDPCNPATLNLKWVNRETRYDHIDTVEEWSLLPSNQPALLPGSQPQKQRTLLNIRRPFANHNGVNSLNFSPETGKLILTTGDGGSGYDPFNLSQNDMEIAGKIIEIDTEKTTNIDNAPVATRFDELPASVLQTLSVIAKGVRNISGISFQRINNQYMKYIGNVGQDLVESIFSFSDYKPIPATRIVEDSLMSAQSDQEGFINFGWRGWEGEFPTPVIKECPGNPDVNEKAIAFYNDAIMTSVQRIRPLTCYYHLEPRPDRFGGIALTGVHPYMGNRIPELTGNVVFTDLARNESTQPPARGVLACIKFIPDCNLHDYVMIETDYDFGSESTYYVSLGANQDQTRLFLGVYGSTNVTDYNHGTVYEIVP